MKTRIFYVVSMLVLALLVAFASKCSAQSFLEEIDLQHATSIESVETKQQAKAAQPKAKPQAAPKTQTPIQIMGGCPNGYCAPPSLNNAQYPRPQFYNTQPVYQRFWFRRR